ncbi:MAG: 2,5-diamino-6-(ribosylamino)-4(3H)-pyrimidinone 5'-phosphate reductase [Anaerolineae bacterium]|nr:2,5-diamino-6-(ribosylamino)-4(3H)-pyrimidinone 5'-phosphate reductase [Anaerolineae bacterium]
MNRPFVFINAAMTVDGKISTVERRQVRISTPKDMERVDWLRASADAIMVGGQTLLRDDPSLTIKSEGLRAIRVRAGRPENPIKVGVSTRAELKDDSDFLNAGEATKIVFTTQQADPETVHRLRSWAEVHILGEREVNLEAALSLLWYRGVRRLMVEGGGTLNFGLLSHGLVDELYVQVGPLIFGGEDAPSLVEGVGLAYTEALRPELLDVERLQDSGVVLRYRVGHKDQEGRE